MDKPFLTFRKAEISSLIVFQHFIHNYKTEADTAECYRRAVRKLSACMESFTITESFILVATSI